MLEQFRIESRAGNRFIAIAGVLYAAAAIPLLTYHVVTTWGAESLIDRALQLALLFTIAAGIALVNIARVNLRRLSTKGTARRSNAEQRPTLSAQSA